MCTHNVEVAPSKIKADIVDDGFGVSILVSAQATRLHEANTS